MGSRVLISCISKGVESRMFVPLECKYQLMNGFIMTIYTKSFYVLIWLVDSKCGRVSIVLFGPSVEFGFGCVGNHKVLFVM